MKAANATVAAITHGFVFGFHAVMGTAAAAAAMSRFAPAGWGSLWRKNTAEARQSLDGVAR
jgi:hypothetical protein